MKPKTRTTQRDIKLIKKLYRKAIRIDRQMKQMAQEIGEMIGEIERIQRIKETRIEGEDIFLLLGEGYSLGKSDAE